ncbi:hypothetical protein [Aquisphaera giovannonii]|uniref:hypothetical protein n=1 Tax=Aquisphaera giovannonii TaxID=406548 RepID=UPI00143DCCCF|nr:hypothetical protein [Aquisphaera giovannonii]
MHGDGPEAEAWHERRRRALLESGSSGLLEDLASEPGDVSELVGYLGPRAARTA